MAAVKDDDVDYESDPEEAKLALTMRRRVASDDEEGDGDEKETESLPARVDSGEESEGQGAAEEYDEEEDEEEEEEEYEEVEVEGEGEDMGGGEVEEVVVENEGSESVGGLHEADGEAEVVGEEGKKENEPFAVPTTGAFYMHDDRFRDNARCRNSRRMFGGRKLWETQDDRKWGHDKFEEMSNQERRYSEGKRNFRGRNRGQGRNRGGDRRNPREDRSKVYDTYNQNQAPKINKGRGFRKYDSLKRNKNEAPQMQYRQRVSKTAENLPQAASGRAPTGTSDLDSGPVSSTKQAFASSLNSASPPFYPSSSSSKETTSIAPVGNVNRSTRAADAGERFSNSNRGRNVADSIGMNKLHINDSISPNAGKVSAGSPMVSSAYPRAQGRGVAASSQMVYQPVAPHNQAARASTPPHYHNMQRGGQSSSQPSLHQSGQFPVGGSQASSTRATLGPSPFEHGESDFPSEASKFKSTLAGKEKSGVQGGGKGSFMYNGSQVMAVSGNMSSGHGDQNFSGAPTFLPVMPFSGQHPGGMGVPAVGMAFPGYVSQPNGLGNPEMTWLPVLAGAAGALGSAYGSPYIALDNAYHSRPSGQTSSSAASSKESNGNKANEWKPSSTPEVTNDEVGQRQKYTRRYTEMNWPVK